jgi:DNA-binding beta-propeller fold protein YncE
MRTTARRLAAIPAVLTACCAIHAAPANATPAESAASAASAALHQIDTVGSAASQMTVDPTRNVVYAAKVNGRVQFIDGRTHAITGTSGPIGELGPDAVAADPPHNWVFATGVSSGSIYRVVGGTRAVASSAPEAATYQGITVNPRTDAVYVGNTDTVEAFDGRTLEHTGVMTLPGGGFNFVDDLAVNPSNDMLYVTDREAVHIFDARTHLLVRSVTVTDGADRIAVNPVDGRVYVTGFHGIAVLSAGGDLVTSVKVRATPFDVAVNVAKNRVYVTSANDGAAHGYLTEIDGSSDALVGSVLVQGPAGYVAVDSRNDTTNDQALPTFRIAPRILVFQG